MKKQQHYLIVIFFLLFAPVSAFANIIYVNPTAKPSGTGTISDPMTLEAGVASAQDGDSVRLQSGLYTVTNEILIDKAITLSGNKNLQVPAKIVCDGPVNCFHVTVPDGSNVNFKRLEMHTTSSEILIYHTSGNLNVDRVFFKGDGPQVDAANPNTANNEAIHSYGELNVKFPVLRVTNSYFRNFFGAVSTIDSAHALLVKNSEFVGNIGSLVFGPSTGNPALQFNNFESVVSGCAFSEGYFSIYAILGAKMTIKDNYFDDNMAGIYLLSTETYAMPFSLFDIQNNQLMNNKTAIFVGTYEVSGTVANNMIFNSEMHPYGSNGIDMRQSGNANQPVLVFNNVIRGFYSHGIRLRANSYFVVAPEGHAIVAYNTVYQEGSVPGDYSAYTFSDFEYLRVVNNIAHYENNLCASCKGFTYDQFLVGYSIVMETGGNNAYAGVPYSFNTVSSPIDLGGDTEVIPPFAIDSLDLQSAFPADPALYLVDQDIEGVARGAQPDKGAYQH